MYVIASRLVSSVAVWTLCSIFQCELWVRARSRSSVGHSQLLAVMNNFPGLNYGPKKSDWLNCPPPEILMVETAMAKNLIGGNPDQK
jgi:hypothetical protein